MSTPPWEQQGPAQAIYDKYINRVMLRDTWVSDVRKAWGNPDHPGLTDYPDVKITQQTVGTQQATVLTPKNPSKDAVLYLHGGGWMTGLSGKHLSFVKHLADNTQTPIYALDYRLAPEHPYPAALNDTLAALHSLQQEPFTSIHLLGDSSGANLAAAACHYTHDHNLKKPDRLLALSPMMDMHMERYPSLARLGVGNPLADMSIIAFQRFCYVPDATLWTSPYVSPLYGALNMLPRTLVISGDDDPLCDDNLAFVKACQRAGTKIQSEHFKNMPHSFFTHADAVPQQAAHAIKIMTEFITKV
jgi:acetyl esterase/lipase